MKYFPLIWAALWRRKLRTWFTLISIVVAFFLFGMLQGVNLGIDGLYDLLTNERLRIAARANNGALPISLRREIAAVDGISAVSPVMVLPGYYQNPDTTVMALAVDIRAWHGTIYPQWELSEAGVAAMERTRNGLVAGRVTAEKYGWQIGDQVSIHTDDLAQADGNLAWTFELVGIYEIPRRPTWATNLFINYDYLNEARRDGKDVSGQYIARVEDAARYAQVATAIDERFANSASQTISRSEEDFVRTMLAQVGNISYLLNGIVGAVLFTLLFLTANTMMLSVRERIPELAALKTLGFTDRALLVMVLAEVLLLCSIAGAAGLGASAVIFPSLMEALGPQVGLEGMRIPPSVFGAGAVIAVLVALVSGLPPAVRAMRLSIVDGLANR
jgi:putative ABC transport system permease protein